jgi:S1-C subfamily serine protease
MHGSPQPLSGASQTLMLHAVPVGRATTYSSVMAVFGIGVLTGVIAARPAQPKPQTPQPERVLIQPTGPAEAITAKTIDPAASGPQTRGDARQVAKKALGFSVYIRGGPVYGAGVVIDAKGHVLTCDHVIDGLDKVEVSFHDDPKSYRAKVLDRDKKLDLALLRIDVPAPAVADVASIMDLSMGDEVFGMGSPRKMGFSLSRGVVSYVGRSFDGTFYVQTDLSANSGSSGGPILNERGDLIGISSFILRGSQGLSFAVPVDYALVRFRDKLGIARDTGAFERWVKARRGGTTRR